MSTRRRFLSTAERNALRARRVVSAPDFAAAVVAPLGRLRLRAIVLGR